MNDYKNSLILQQKTLQYKIENHKFEHAFNLEIEENECFICEENLREKIKLEQESKALISLDTATFKVAILL